MNKEDTRTLILQTAALLFAQKGFAETSMNNIVEITGLSKGGIYWHFKSKDEIIAAIFDQFFEQQLAIEADLLPESGTVKGRLLQIVEQMGASLEQKSEAFPQPFDFYMQAFRTPTLREHLAQHFLNYQQGLTRLIQQGIDEQEFSVPNAAEAARVLLAALEGVILITTLVAPMQSITRDLVTATELVLNGMSNDGMSNDEQE